MKKAAFTLSIIALASAGTVGAAAYAGSAVTQRMQTQVRDLTKLLPFAKVVKEEKSGGLFRSRYDLTLQFGCFPALPLSTASAAGSAPEPLVLRVHNEIQHGPFPGGTSLGAARIHTEVRLSEQRQKQLEKILGAQPLISADTQVKMTGDYESDFALPEIKVAQGSDALRLESVHGTARGKSGATGKVPYSFEIPEVNGSLQSGHQTFSFEAQGIAASGTVQSQGDKRSWLSDSESRATIQVMRVRGAVPTDLGTLKPFVAELSGATVTARTDIDKSGLWSSQSSIVVGGRVNDFKIDKVEGQVSFKRLHAATYQTMLEQLADTLLTCSSTLPDPAKVTEQARGPMVQLLKYDPEYSLDKLRVVLEGKALELSYSVGTSGIAAADLGPLASPDALAQKLKARGAVKVHMGLVERAAAEIAKALQGDDGSAAAAQLPPPGMIGVFVDRFAQTGYIKREGDYISAEASYQSGELRINGQPLALPKLPIGP